jgi:hypothetical protein
MARPIPTPDVQFCDPKTGLITQPWFEYFKSRDRGAPGAGGGSNVSAWFYGTLDPAVPADALVLNKLGVNDDFYIRLSGSSVVGIFVKQNGAWV